MEVRLCTMMWGHHPFSILTCYSSRKNEPTNYIQISLKPQANPVQMKAEVGGWGLAGRLKGRIPSGAHMLHNFYVINLWGLIKLFSEITPDTSLIFFVGFINRCQKHKSACFKILQKECIFIHKLINSKHWLMMLSIFLSCLIVATFF